MSLSFLCRQYAHSNDAKADTIPHELRFQPTSHQHSDAKGNQPATKEHTSSTHNKHPLHLHMQGVPEYAIFMTDPLHLCKTLTL